VNFRKAQLDVTKSKASIAMLRTSADSSKKNQKRRYGIRGLGECDQESFEKSKRRAYCGLFFNVM